MNYRYLPYTLRLESPALVPRLDGDPNSAIATPFLPGSTLRGLVAARLGDPESDPAALTRFRRLVLGGAVRYLHAYPATGEHRSLPAPASLRPPKGMIWLSGQSARMTDLSFYDSAPGADHDIEECWPEDELGDLPARYLTLTAPVVERVEVKLSSRIHHQRDREYGRAWTRRVPQEGGRPDREERQGAVYVYESLDAGQEFRGLVLLCGETREDLDKLALELQQLLERSPERDRPLTLGRSRRASYGGNASLCWGVGTTREVSGEGLQERGLVDGDWFRVLLTSAYVGRDPETGQLDPTCLCRELENALVGRVTVDRWHWSFAPVGGYNRKWGLPLPQALGVESGAVLVLRAQGVITAQELRELEHAGLGERREEGFGRFVFLQMPDDPEFTADWPDHRQTAHRPAGEPPLVALEAERQIVRERLAEAIAEVAAETVRRAARLPSNSLLGRLRVPLRGSADDALSTLGVWLGAGRDSLRRPARDALSRCRVTLHAESLSLLLWLQRIAVSEDLGSLLNYPALAQDCYLVSEESARAVLLQETATSRVRLIDAVLALLERRNKLEAGGNHD